MRADDPTGALAETIGSVLLDFDAVAAAYLYGSAARQTATPLSDVDVALVAPALARSADRGRRLLDALSAAVLGRFFSDG